MGWCQQLPPYLNQPSTVRENLQRKSLWRLQLEAIESLDIPWFNRPSHVLAASSKIKQLILASEIGFEVPETLISNIPEDIREFSADKLVVAKNLATPWVLEPEKVQAAYTRIVQQCL
jgi:glutathione synthase/RimK-type ligase-like ATP-grasp enzyme